MYFILLNDLLENNCCKNSLLPATDIVENDEKYFQSMEVPGLTKEDIKIKVNNNILTITGSYKEKKLEEESKYIYKEITSKSFTRSFPLSDKCNLDSIKATVKNGILSITIDKKEETKPKDIEIS